MSVALTRKSLTLDAVQLHALAARRGASESAAAREAIEAALFADEFVDLLRQLREAGFDVDDHGGSVPRTIKAAGGKVWSPFFRDLAPAALAEAKALGLPVVVWTVNERADMIRLIEMGVDGIISDRPDILRDAMAEKGLSLPPAMPVAP